MVPLRYGPVFSDTRNVRVPLPATAVSGDTIVIQDVCVTRIPRAPGGRVNRNTPLIVIGIRLQLDACRAETVITRRRPTAAIATSGGGYRDRGVGCEDVAADVELEMDRLGATRIVLEGLCLAVIVEIWNALRSRVGSNRTLCRPSSRSRHRCPPVPRRW